LIGMLIDGNPGNTTLIIDGVDVTDEYEVGWITIEAFGRDPLEIKLPYFKLQYGIIENNPLDEKVVETHVLCNRIYLSRRFIMGATMGKGPGNAGVSDPSKKSDYWKAVQADLNKKGKNNKTTKKVGR